MGAGPKQNVRQKQNKSGGKMELTNWEQTLPLISDRGGKEQTPLTVD